AFLDWARDKRRYRAWTQDRALGRRGEDLAHRYLRRQGFTIVARNYKLASGKAEGDIIARDGEELVIVEVKTRATDDYGPPERAIGPDKQRQLIRVARAYARKIEWPWERVRFDVVTVVLGSPPKINLIRGAFHP